MHEKLFEGKNSKPLNGRKKKQGFAKSKLASTVTRSGRVTWISYQDNDKPTYGLNNAEIAVVAFYFPSFEETWGYATTDADGYWSADLEVPAGETLASLTGIQVYFKNDDADIEVKHPTTGLYMYETAQNSPYNTYFDSLHTYNPAARMHWPIMQSYAISSANGFDGDSVDVIFPDSSEAAEGWYDGNGIHMRTWDWRYSHSTMAH